MQTRIYRLPLTAAPRSFCSVPVRMQPRRPQQVLVKENGLQVAWSPSHSSFFHREWLHRNRPGAISSSGQNMQESRSEAPERIRSAAFNGERMTVEVVWEGEAVASEYPVKMLQEQDCSSGALKERSMQRKSTPLMERNGGTVPRISYDRVMTSEDGVFEWMDHIMQDGLCIVQDTPCHEEGEVTKLARRIGNVMDTIYGEIWDVRLEHDPINIAYTSLGLDLHQDLAYYESPPGLQLLHCMRFDDGILGGDSTFADAIQAAELLRKSDKEAFDTLVRVPATFQKIHYARASPVHLKYQRPHIVLNHDEEVVAVFWAPAFEGPLQVPEGQVQRYFDAYKKFAHLVEDEANGLKISFRLKQGETVVFNNRRMLHGRTSFKPSGTESATRHLQGCYLSIESFVSRYNCLLHERSCRSENAYVPRDVRVGDQNFF